MAIFLDITTETVGETQLMGELFATILRSGDLVLLIGDLGAGKTTFTSGIVKKLCPNEQVTSPTFTLMHHYEGQIDILHIDLWRLDEDKDILDLGVWEYLDQGAVALVEWGDKAKELLGTPRFLVNFRLLPDGEETRRQALFFAVTDESKTEEIAAAYGVIEAYDTLGPIVSNPKYDVRLTAFRDLLRDKGISVSEREAL